MYPNLGFGLKPNHLATLLHAAPILVEKQKLLLLPLLLRGRVARFFLVQRTKTGGKYQINYKIFHLVTKCTK
jgi:hypothetical protein